jgi:hypothetical protein
MKEFLVKIIGLTFIFFLVVQFYVLLTHFGEKLFGCEHEFFMKTVAGIVSMVLLISSIISFRKCKTFKQTDHKINKIR